MPLLLLLLLVLPVAAPAAAPPSAVITGTLVSEADGSPLSGATIGLCEHLDQEAELSRRAALRFVPEPIGTTATDGAGRFAIPVSAGEGVYLIARAPGHAGSIITLPFIPDGSADIGVIRLPAGRRLAGKVLRPDGAPAPKVLVLGIALEAIGPAPFEPIPLSGQGTSDENGSFVLEDIGMKGVHVRAVAEGMAFLPKETRKEGDEVVVRLQPAVSIPGRVLAPDGETPVAGAWVAAEDGGIGPIVRAGEDGAFLLGRLSASEVAISASAPRIEEGPMAMLAPSLPAKVLAGSSAAVTLRLRRGALLRARVVDGNRGPIPMALVRFYSDGPGRTGWTDADGQAVFPGSAPGRIFGQAMAQGYGENRLPDVTVLAGEDRRVTIRLEKPASLQGRVVAAEGGGPIEGALLLAGTLRPHATSVRDAVDLGGLRSAADGTFLLPALPPDEKILVEARLPGDAASRIEIDPLAPGERRSGAEIRMQKGLTIVGRAVDPDGQPITGARVVATEAGTEDSLELRIGWNSSPPERAGDPALAEVITDEKGRFSVQGAREGRWSIAIKASGFALKVVHAVAVEITTGGDAGDITLDRGVRVRGRVVDEQGRPVGVFRVSLQHSGRVFSFQDVEEREDGTFESTDLPPGGRYDLDAEAEGFLRTTIRDLAPPVNDLVVTLSKGLPLSGKVVDARAGSPVTDYMVSISYPGPPGSGKLGFERGDVESVRSEAGEFTLPNVRPGPARLEVTANGYVTGVIEGLEIDAEGPGEPITVRLERSVTVSGQVVDEDGRPVSDVVIARGPAASAMSLSQMLDLDEGSTTTSDGNGDFRLDLPSADPLRLRLRRDGFVPAELDVDPSGKRDGLRAVLRRGAVLTGVVLKESDRFPVRGAKVWARRAEAGFFDGAGRAETGQDGTFRIEGLRPGTYDLTASARGLRDGEAQAVVGQSGAAPVTLTLGVGVRLTGTITGLEPSALDRLTVRVGGDEADVDAHGRFQADGLSAGGNILIIRSSDASASGAGQHTLRIDIPEGVATWDATFDLAAGFRVSGRVSRGGQPVAGAKILFVETAGEVAAETETGPGGDYAVHHLSPGTYKILLTDGVNLSLDLAESVTIEGDRRHDIILPAGRITGTITAASTDRAIRNSSVMIETTGGSVEDQALNLMKPISVDAEGRFSITGLSEGIHRVTARAPGFGYEMREVVLGPGAPEATVSFSLSAADALEVRALLAATGEPAAGGLFAMAVIPGGGDPLGLSGSGDRAVFQGLVQPDASGRFLIESLKPGAYDIVLWIPGLVAETLRGVVVPSAEVTATLRAGSEVTLSTERLPDGPDGRVVLLDSLGRPARLHALLADPALPLRKGVKGVAGILGPGTYTLRGRLPDGRIIEKTFTVTPGAGTEIVIP